MSRRPLNGMIVSRSGTEYPRAPPLCEEALQERELVWARLPKTIYQGTLSYLEVREVGRMDIAMTNKETRPHLVKAYKDLVSPAFNGYLYRLDVHTGQSDNDILRWVMEREIDLRGFKINIGGGDDVRSGPVLVRLMGGDGKDDLNLDIATYYAMRGRLTHLNLVHRACTALTKACGEGYLEIVKCLLAAGADTDKVNSDGRTALIRAARGGHGEVVQLLLSAGADTDKADSGGSTPLIWAAGGLVVLIDAARWGHVEVVQLLLAAGADKDKADNDGRTALSLATEDGHREIVQLLQPATPQT